MDDNELKAIIEALLMSATEPLTIDRLESVFDDWYKPEPGKIQEALTELARDYETSGIELTTVAGGYRFQTRSQYSHWVARLFAEKPAKYSRALLETLAIIAWQQPVTRADIEDIRGVAVSSPMLKTLIEREWIRIAGHRDVPGKPAVYVTTRTFLDYFNLKSLSDLPPLPEREESSMATNIEECVE